jgi:hypothetical protein
VGGNWIDCDRLAHCEGVELGDVQIHIQVNSLAKCQTISFAYYLIKLMGDCDCLANRQTISLDDLRIHRKAGELHILCNREPLCLVDFGWSNRL